MPTSILTLPQSNLARNAGFSSVPNPGALALPANCTSLTCTLTMGTADQTNTSNAITWTVFCAPPGAAPTLPPNADGTPGGGWTPVAREVWQGGTFVDHAGNTQPSDLTFTESVPAQFAGGYVAAGGQNLGATLKVGCTVVSNP